MRHATQDQMTGQILLHTSLRARRETLRGDLLTRRAQTLRPAQVRPTQVRATQPSRQRDGLGLAERLATTPRPVNEPPIDFGALVHRGEVFRRARTVAFACAGMTMAILFAYTVTGLAILLAILCVLAVTGGAATYLATRLASAPLPRVQR